jgi:uncharacterized protein (DUF697 family)
MLKSYRHLKSFRKAIKSTEKEATSPVKILLVSDSEKVYRLLATGASDSVIEKVALKEVSVRVKKRPRQVDLLLLVLTWPILNKDLSKVALFSRHFNQALAIIDSQEEVELKQVKFLAEQFGLAVDDFVILPLEDQEVLQSILIPKIIKAFRRKRVSLAAKLPVFRREVTREIIRSTAWQNSLISAIGLLPGADMPVLTLNQVKMVLRIAAVHGQKISTVSHLFEVLATIGSGVLFRGIARELLSIAPGVSWMAKGSVAYLGTYMLGRAAESFFKGALKGN